MSAVMNTVLPAPERPVTPSRTVGLNKPSPNSPSARPARRISSLMLVREGMGRLEICARGLAHQSGGFGVERAWDHEAVEPAGLGMELAPVVEREVDHCQRRSRKFLDQLLARLDIARG